MDSALRQSEVRYRRLFEAAKDGILILTGDTVKIIDANPFMTELLGYSRDEFLGKELWEIGLFADKRASQAVYETLRENGYVRYDNLPLQSKSGKKAEVEFVSNVYREGDHSVIQCNVRDISERTRLERELKGRDRRFRTLVEQVKDYAIFMTDTERRATSWNEGVRQVLGFGEGEWIGRDVVPLIFTPEAIRDGVAQKEFDDAKAHGRGGDDRWMVRKGGARFFAYGVLTALRGDDGGLLGFTKVVRDQTERKRLEDDLHRHAEQLAEQHRLKDEFLAMLGHELRNPLAPIANAVQLLRLRENEDQLQQKARTIIERQVGQLTRIVDELLEVTRITSGRIQLRHDRLAVSSLVERAVETARPVIDQRGHELTVSLPPDPIWLDADPTRMEQVVVNLLANAAKYTGECGRIWLTVRREGAECVLRVKDTGEGIAPALLPYVFDLFTQAERSLDRSQGGLGIGLALVQRLVELHGGRIEARSTLGGGSEFTVRLPAAAASADRPLVPAEAAGPTGPSVRVLVVDDNVDAAESLADVLRALGHDVRTAHDGPAGLEAAADFRPDVALLDIGLPGLDGYEVARRLRRQPSFRSLVLAAMTGYGQEGDRRKARDAGFDHHLVKPVDPAALAPLLTRPG